jgi:hypothetical protein
VPDIQVFNTKPPKLKTNRGSGSGKYAAVKLRIESLEDGEWLEVPESETYSKKQRDNCIKLLRAFIAREKIGGTIVGWSAETMRVVVISGKVEITEAAPRPRRRTA